MENMVNIFLFGKKYQVPEDYFVEKENKHKCKVLKFKTNNTD